MPVALLGGIRMNRIKIELAAELSRLKRSSSVWIAGAWAVFFTLGPEAMNVWRDMPDDLKQMLPNGWGRYIAGAAFIMTFVARVVRVSFVPKEAQKDGNSQ